MHGSKKMKIKKKKKKNHFTLKRLLTSAFNEYLIKAKISHLCTCSSSSLPSSILSTYLPISQTAQEETGWPCRVRSWIEHVPICRESAAICRECTTRLTFITELKPPLLWNWPTPPVRRERVKARGSSLSLEETVMFSRNQEIMS